MFGSVPQAPVDPILSMTQRYKADTDERKVNLGVGAYRDGNGKPFVLRVVKEVEKRMLEENLNKEYIPQDGLPQFYKEATRLMYGDKLVNELGDRIVGVQSISGTGALRLGFEFLRQFKGPKTPVFVPNLTWGNHYKVMNEGGMRNINTYRYYDPSTRALNFDAMIDDLQNAPEESIVLLHLCAHNPTGVDPTREQWKDICKIIMEKNHIPFFDSAYQGIASGDPDKDAFAVRHFVEQGKEVMTAQSFAKNLGLYGERIGCLSFVTNSEKNGKAIRSQVKTIVRAMYSSPPLHGAQIVARVLSDKQLYKLWMEDLTAMSKRIMDMRRALYNHLQELKTPGNWEHILNQIGMFTFTGLNQEQSKLMISKHHIYMLTNGRISMSGLNTKNVEYVARAMHDIVTNH